MAQGKQIICPYCCRRFMPNQVDFRLERPLRVAEPEESYTEQPAAQEDQMPSLLGLSMPKAPTRPRPQRPQGRADGRVRDDKLHAYYMNFLNLSGEDAESNAMRLPAVSVDYMSPEVQYNSHTYAQYGYVTEIVFMGQTLNERLCPYCHNTVIGNAGKYDMMILSVIGDTDVGKSIYLSVLVETLKQDRSFNGSLMFMGTDAEREIYIGNLEKLLNKSVLQANDRVKVPPMPFLYTYGPAGSDSRYSVILVFCDIAGEDCRNRETLKRNGYHLKASSGILFLIDPSRFSRVKHALNFEKDSGNAIEGRHQYEILEAINRYLMDDPGMHRSAIPTAIVLTKSDMLTKIGWFRQDPNRMSLLEDTRGSGIHPGFMSMQEIGRMNMEIRRFIEENNEGSLLNVDDLFSNTSFFVCSALGMEPEFVDVTGGIRTVREKRVRAIQPYRVTEPLYWLLMQSGYIPLRETEFWQNKKNEMREVVVYYYATEPRESIEERRNAMRGLQGITEPEGFVARLMGPGWVKLRTEIS